MGGLSICFAVCLVITFTSARQTRYAMRGAAIMGVLLVSFWGGKLAVYPGGYVSNVGNIAYSMALSLVAWLEVTDPSIAKLMHRQARPWAHETPLKMIGLDTVYMLMFWSLSSFFYVQGLGVVPLVEGNEAMTRAIITIAESQRYVALASWSAFAVSMVAIAFCAQAFWRWRVSVPVPLATLICVMLGQVVDSIVFFPLAFYNLPQWQEMMLTGLCVKAVLTPIFVAVIAISRNGAKDTLPTVEV